MPMIMDGDQARLYDIPPEQVISDIMRTETAIKRPIQPEGSSLSRWPSAVDPRRPSLTGRPGCPIAAGPRAETLIWPAFCAQPGF